MKMQSTLSICNRSSVFSKVLLPWSHLDAFLYQGRTRTYNASKTIIYHQKFHHTSLSLATSRRKISGSSHSVSSALSLSSSSESSQYPSLKEMSTGWLSNWITFFYLGNPALERSIMPQYLSEVQIDLCL